MILRDIVTCREGFFKQVIICASVCTVAYIAYAAAEAIIGDGLNDMSVRIIENVSPYVNYAVGVIGTFAASALVATLSSLMSRPFYYDSGNDAVRMISDLSDYIHTKSDAKPSQVV